MSGRNKRYGWAISGAFALIGSVLWLPAAWAQYQRTNMVSDGSVSNTLTDSNLVNAWGISLGPTSPIWVNNNGSGTATVYQGNGQGFPTGTPLVVTIPGAGGAQGTPTGQIFNPTSDFAVTSGGNSGSAVFLFAGEDGTVSGWNPTVNPTNAIMMKDNSPSGSAYKGLAMGNAGGNNQLYLADFHNNKVDVLDKGFAGVTPSGTFTDPNLPAGFAPFNVANIGGKLYVSYAMQDQAAHDDVKGPGNGFVDVFDTDGNLLNRAISAGVLSSPWAMVQAPSDFGKFSNDLLVGNFGDGTIHAFDPTTFALAGQLTDAQNNPIVIDGLWGLAFGNDANGAPHNALFFTAGPNDEGNGLFGRLEVASRGGGVVPLPAAAVTFPLGAVVAAYCARRLRAAA